MIIYKYFYSSEEAVGSTSDFWSNFTKNYAANNDDFTSNYVAPEDVSVDAVLTSIYLNSIAFVLLMCTYECLRRLLPSVYSSQIKRQYKNYGSAFKSTNTATSDDKDSAEILKFEDDEAGTSGSTESGMDGRPPRDHDASLANLRSYSHSFMLPDLDYATRYPSYAG
ncbi:MAG: hypothetical protein SGARI_007807, partial [Bacillariaceae sp.]